MSGNRFVHLTGRFAQKEHLIVFPVAADVFENSSVLVKPLHFSVCLAGGRRHANHFTSTAATIEFNRDPELANYTNTVEVVREKPLPVGDVRREALFMGSIPETMMPGYDAAAVAVAAAEAVEQAAEDLAETIGFTVPVVVLGGDDPAATRGEIDATPDPAPVEAEEGDTEVIDIADLPPDVFEGVVGGGEQDEEEQLVSNDDDDDDDVENRVRRAAGSGAPGQSDNPKVPKEWALIRASYDRPSNDVVLPAVDVDADVFGQMVRSFHEAVQDSMKLGYPGSADLPRVILTKKQSDPNPLNVYATVVLPPKTSIGLINASLVWSMLGYLLPSASAVVAGRLQSALKKFGGREDTSLRLENSSSSNVKTFVADYPRKEHAPIANAVHSASVETALSKEEFANVCHRLASKAVVARTRRLSPTYQVYLDLSGDAGRLYKSLMDVPFVLAVANMNRVLSVASIIAGIPMGFDASDNVGANDPSAAKKRLFIDFPARRVGSRGKGGLAVSVFAGEGFAKRLGFADFVFPLHLHSADAYQSPISETSAYLRPDPMDVDLAVDETELFECTHYNEFVIYSGAANSARSGRNYKVANDTPARKVRSHAELPDDLPSYAYHGKTGGGPSRTSSPQPTEPADPETEAATAEAGARADAEAERVDDPLADLSIIPVARRPPPDMSDIVVGAYQGDVLGEEGVARDKPFDLSMAEGVAENLPPLTAVSAPHPLDYVANTTTPHDYSVLENSIDTTIETPFERVTIPNPRPKPPATYQQWLTTYGEVRCPTTGTAFPDLFYLLSHDGDRRDWLGPRGYVSLLGQFSKKESGSVVFSNGVLLRNCKNLRQLTFEIVTPGFATYVCPVLGDDNGDGAPVNDINDGFANLTLLVSPASVL